MFLDKHIFIKRKSLTEDQCSVIKNYIDDSDLIPNRGIYYMNQCRCSSTPHPFMIDSLKESLNEYIKKHSFLTTLYAPWGISDLYHLQKYLPGMSYAGEHMEHGKDVFDSKRLLAWMIYLNTVTDGGGTRWPQQNFKAKARVGDLLIWPAGWTHSHHGIVSNTETKYIVTGWCEFM